MAGDDEPFTCRGSFVTGSDNNRPYQTWRITVTPDFTDTVDIAMVVVISHTYLPPDHQGLTLSCGEKSEQQQFSEPIASKVTFSSDGWTCDDYRMVSVVNKGISVKQGEPLEIVVETDLGTGKSR